MFSVPDDPRSKQLPRMHGDTGAVKRSRSIHVIVLAAWLLAGCDALLRPMAATPAPLCAPIEAQLGSMQLDYGAVTGTPVISQSDAEMAARRVGGIPDAVTTCFVRLARYNNLGVERDRVWVVMFDGLSWTALGGPFVESARPRPSPATLRRALFIVSADEPGKVIESVAVGP